MTTPNPSTVASLFGFKATSTISIRRLSPADMEDRHRKGLCFNFDEQFQRGHQCKTKQLSLMEGDWAEDDGDPEEPSDDDRQLVEVEA